LKCPWGCGWEGSSEEYSKHYDTCEKRPLHYGVMKKEANPISGETVETINIPLLLGSDFKVTYQGPYQVSFDHQPTSVHLAILKRAGPHRHLPTPYRVWLYKGLTQMLRNVYSLEEAVNEIRKLDIAKEFPPNYEALGPTWQERVAEAIAREIIAKGRFERHELDNLTEKIKKMLKEYEKQWG